MTPIKYNELIDPAVLFTLYENDPIFIEKIFRSFLDNSIDGDIQQIESCFTSGDNDGLRKVIHKLKPAFGFVGLTSIEEQCRELELLCGSGQPLSGLKEKIMDLLTAIRAGKMAVEEDLQKLIQFNKN